MLKRAYAIVLVALGLVACNAILGNEERHLVGKPCSLNGDCTDNQLCLFGRCSDRCRVDRDCAPGSRCLTTDQFPACVESAKALCSESCPGGTVCSSSDGVCRSPCSEGGEMAGCRSDQTCTDEGVCLGKDTQHDVKDPLGSGHHDAGSGVQSDTGGMAGNGSGGQFDAGGSSGSGDVSGGPGAGGSGAGGSGSGGASVDGGTGNRTGGASNAGGAGSGGRVNTGGATSSGGIGAGGAPATGGTGTGGTGTGGAGTGGTPTTTTTLGSATVMISAGQETTWCEEFANPFKGQDIGIVESTVDMGPTGFVATVYASPSVVKNSAPSASGCPSAAGTDLVHLTVSGSDTITYPATVGHYLPKTNGLQMSVHYVNVATDNVAVTPKLTLKTAAGNYLLHHADMVLLNAININVPARAQQDIKNVKNVSFAIHVLDGVGLMYRYGTMFTATHTNGLALYQANDWSQPGEKVFTPPTPIATGADLTWICHYDNTGDTTITFGQSVETDGVCMFAAAYYADSVVNEGKPL